MDPRRNLIVKEALEWCRTPFSRVPPAIKGVGCDCLTFIAAVYQTCGLASGAAIPSDYQHDWHIHRSDERYLAGVSQYATEVAEPPQRLPLPGDIVLWRFGRCFSHGAIVVAWPRIIHAWMAYGLVLEDDARASWLCIIGEESGSKSRPRKVFRPKEFTE